MSVFSCASAANTKKPSERGKETIPVSKDKITPNASIDGDLEELITKSERKASVPLRDNVPPISSSTHQVNDTVYVFPEQKTFVDFSKTDVNRLHCEGDRDMSGAVFSEDKGLVINRSGADAFLRIVPETYAFQSPFELFMICSNGAANNSLYRIIGNPVLELSKNIILKNDGEKMHEAINFFKGKTREQSIVEIIRKTWEENWETSWIVTPRFKKVVEKPEFAITWYRSVDTSAEWVVELYVIEAKANNVSIPETAFVNAQTAAVSILDPVIENGKIGQVIVIREKAATL